MSSLKLSTLAANVINDQHVPNEWAYVQYALLRDIAISLRAIG